MSDRKNRACSHISAQLLIVANMYLHLTYILDGISSGEWAETNRVCSNIK